MGVELPPALAAAVQDASSGVSRRGLSERAARVSQAYRGRADSSQAIGSRDDALAYALARAPATYAACTAVFAEARRVAPDFEPRSLLDAGAGPGGASWAAVGAWPTLERATLLDANRPFLELARQLAGVGPPALAAAAVEARDITSPGALPGAELVVASYALAEIGSGRLGDLLDRLWGACEGVLALVEPGTPQGFERLRAVRQRLLGGGARILAPCPHDAECPMAPPDWCHFVQRLPRSRDHMRLKGAELPFEDEKFAYLLAARPSLSVRNRGSRILARPRQEKATVELKLCTPAGLQARTVARRDKAAWRAARKLDWGDALDETNGEG